jgi:formate hydrogenlyase subunit 3/multisubunit Na+/H+ antiporter MnhD subunit
MMAGYAALLWLVPVWPLLLALSLTLPAVRPYGIRLLPWALLPAALVWLVAGAAQIGWLERLYTDWLYFDWPLFLYAPDLLMGTRITLDSLSYIWLSLALFVWGAAAWHSSWVKDRQAWRFSLFFLLSLSGSLGLSLAGDAISFYLMFSLMSLAAWGLVIHEQTDFAKRAAHWYLILAVLAELVLFAGIVARAAELGSTDLAVWAVSGSAEWGLWLIWLGLAVKVGVPLLHLWLPLAHPAAPVSASAVLSGVMIKAGIIGWWLLMPSWVMQDSVFVSFMPWLGVATMVFGAVFGLMQTDPKAVLAYSSISQMGWLIWGIGWVWQGAEPSLLMIWVAWFALHHALIKGGLFLGVGWIKYSTAGQGFIPWVWGGLILLGLLLAGMPFSAGAWLKMQMKLASVDVGLVMPYWLLLLGSVATVLLMIHFLRRLAKLDAVSPDQAKPVSRMALVSWFGLVALAASWIYWVAMPSWDSGALIDALKPIVIGLILATAWRIRIHKQIQSPPGDMVVLLEGFGRRLAAWGEGYQQSYQRLQFRIGTGWQRMGQGYQSFLQRADTAEKNLLNWPRFMQLLGGLALVFWLLLIL